MPTSDHPYILTESEIEKLPGDRKTHFLNERAMRINKSLGEAVGITGMGIHIIEVEPGNLTTEFHVHHHEDEAIFVLAGSALARIGDQTFQVSAGDFIGFPKGGQAHALENNSDVMLRCLVVGQRLPHDVGDYPDRKKRIYRNANLPWDVVDADNIWNPAGKGPKP